MSSQPDSNTAENPAAAPLDARLRRARIACGLGTWMAGLGRACVAALLLAVVFALLDLGFVLESGSRRLLLGIWLGFIALWVSAEVLWALRSARLVPREYDLINRDPRRTIACALSISEPDSPLGQWLREQSRREACDALRRAEHSGHPLLRRLAWALGYLLVTGGILGILTAAAPRAVETLGLRLFCPSLDIPPYSPYEFELTPAEPSVLYGDDITLSAAISGGEPPSDVSLLLETPGLPLQKLPAFRDSEGRWSFVLEKVTGPCRIAFALSDGSARSRFVDVTVIRNPRITAASATVRPPAYTGLPERRATLGGSEIMAPDGSVIDFELTGSMDIAAGYAEFVPAGGGEPQRAEGRAEGRTMRVSLPVRRPGVVTLQISDAAGREAPMPMKTRIGIVPDMAPEVRIAAPEDGSYVVAGSPLTIEVEAADDYALTRLNLYKALRPYRQHGVSILDQEQKTRLYTCTIDTAALDLREGEVIELRAEASDANPYRYNIISSGTTTLSVITPEQYREILMLETSYEEFMERYRVLAEARDRSLRAIENARNAPPLERSRHLMSIITGSNEAKQIAAALAGDFPVFDMDGKLSEVARKLVEVFARNAADAARLTVATPEEEYLAALRTMHERLEELQQDLDAEMAQAELVALGAEAQDAVAVFRELTNRQLEQVDLLRRFMDEYGAKNIKQPERLEGLADDQSVLQRDYSDWLDSLSGLIERLSAHEELGEMALMLQALQEACLGAEIDTLMAYAARYAANREPAEAHRAAATALERMQKIARKEASEQTAADAAEKCCGQMSSQAAETLRQMINAMQQRRQQRQQAQQQCSQPSGQQQNQQKGQQQQQGAGSGSSKMATAPSRFRPTNNKKSKIGTRRSNKMHGRGQGKPRKGDGSGDGWGRGDGDARPSALAEPGRRRDSGRDANIEQVPPAYRDAVKAYFSN